MATKGFLIIYFLTVSNQGKYLQGNFCVNSCQQDYTPDTNYICQPQYGFEVGCGYEETACVSHCYSGFYPDENYICQKKIAVAGSDVACRSNCVFSCYPGYFADENFICQQKPIVAGSDVSCNTVNTCYFADKNFICQKKPIVAGQDVACGTVTFHKDQDIPPTRDEGVSQDFLPSPLNSENPFALIMPNLFVFAKQIDSALFAPQPTTLRLISIFLYSSKLICQPNLQAQLRVLNLVPTSPDPYNRQSVNSESTYVGTDEFSFKIINSNGRIFVRRLQDEINHEEAYQPYASKCRSISAWGVISQNGVGPFFKLDSNRNAENNLNAYFNLLKHYYTYLYEEESVGLKIKILMSQSGPTKARSKDQNIIENVWGKSNMRLDMMSIIIEMSYGIVFINNGLIFQIILSNLFTKVYLREQSQSYNQIKSQESHTKN
ncbi:hypothetical protein ABPG74_019103 [Tetrahymena malaccensis]